MNGIEEQKEEGEIDVNSPQPTKVHLRGLNTLNTLDIREWVGEYCPMDSFERVEWIDDSSANLVYGSSLAADEALTALSTEEVLEPLQPMRAQPLSRKPDVQLQVRQAIIDDVKVPGAKDRSAYYLFHREWDPDNPDNIRPDRRKRKWRDEGGGDRMKYRRREWDDEVAHRRGSTEDVKITEDMYDDGPTVTSTDRHYRPTYTLEKESGRRSSYSSAGERTRRGRRGNEDLFAANRTGRLRDRSASPDRDGDGRYGFEETQPYRRPAPPRPISPAGRLDREAHRGPVRKELFPNKRAESALSNDRATGAVELFPSRRRKSTPVSAPKELFPDKLGTPIHRRQDARDLRHQEPLGGYHPFREPRETSLQLTPSSAADRPPSRHKPNGKDLFSRITGGPSKKPSNSRPRSDDASFRAPRAASPPSPRTTEDIGFSIKGASREPMHQPVRELFPRKPGTALAGTLAFDGRIKGRARRLRAEDVADLDDLV